MHTIGMGISETKQLKLCKIKKLTSVSASSSKKSAIFRECFYLRLIYLKEFNKNYQIE